jgi:hypothetical protein
LNIGEDFDLEFREQLSVFVDYLESSRIGRPGPELERFGRHATILAKRAKAAVVQGRLLDLRPELANATEDMI